MKINGVELDFHLFDEDKSEIRERYFEELNKMKTIKKDQPNSTEAEKSKYLCDRIKSMFDNVFGEGTGKAVCGEGNDLLSHLTAYEELVAEQIRQNEAYKRVMGSLKNVGKFSTLKS